MSKKQAVLVVSFGTSHLDTLEKNISAIERTICQALPDWTFRRAFTSTIIMKKLRHRDGMEIDNVAQALTRLEQEAYNRVLLQPTHVINGEEYDKLCALAAPFRDRMEIVIGTPLLTSIQDYKDTAAAILEAVGQPADDEALLFMGHGTPHFANSTYALLEYVLQDVGMERTFIGTVEGYPELEQVLRRLKKQPQIRKVRLQPLMVVAGDHAKNDMAGPEDGSWRNQLEAAGYEVNCVLKGMGEYESIRKLFAHHALEAASREPEV